MTIDVMGDESSSRDALELTEHLFRVAIGDLNEAMTAIREGRIEAATEGKKAVRLLSDLSLRVLEERRNVERLRKNLTGVDEGWSELDLDAARDEIRRRLACLRDARGD